MSCEGLIKELTKESSGYFINFLPPVAQTVLPAFGLAT
jgi:hypothetical protein